MLANTSLTEVLSVGLVEKLMAAALLNSAVSFSVVLRSFDRASAIATESDLFKPISIVCKSPKVKLSAAVRM